MSAWSPGVCSWCEAVMLVTTVTRSESRDFCGPCLDKLATANHGTDYVAHDGQGVGGR